jgi:saccharopine dehydrogenase-like NADP-dependent oxidoreductase
MMVGATGAKGRLGGLIVGVLNQAGADVAPIDLRGVEDERAYLAELDVLVVTTPSTDAHLHRAAVFGGCHVLDVTVDAKLNAELLDLDGLAIDARRSVIPMAGLAPGLTGALAQQVLAASGMECGRSSR